MMTRLNVKKIILAGVFCSCSFTGVLAAIELDAWRELLGELSISQPAFADSGLDAVVLHPESGWALAQPSTGSGRKTTTPLRIEVPAGSDPVDLELPGTLRAFIFSASGDKLFTAIEKPKNSKKAPVEVYLASIDLLTLEAKRRIRLPATTHALAWSDQGRLLLIGCTNEIRSLTFPDLRSGPLYPVPGENRALLAANANEVWVGQSNRWIQLDLNDTPVERAMPIRQSGNLPFPPHAIAKQNSKIAFLLQAPNGDSSGSRNASTIIRTDYVPLQIAAKPLRPDGPIEPTPPKLAETKPEETPVERLESKKSPDSALPKDPQPSPSSEPPAEPKSLAETNPVQQTSEEKDEESIPLTNEKPNPNTPKSPLKEPVELPPPQPQAADESPTAPAEANVRLTEKTESAQPQPPSPTDSPTTAQDQTQSQPKPRAQSVQNDQVVGILSGSIGDVSAMVTVAGPNNLLKIATRVPVSSDGTFSINDLLPGRYRLTVDAGKDARAITQPPFLILNISSENEFYRLPTWQLVRVD